MNNNRNTILVFLMVFFATALFRVIPYDLRAGWLGAPQFAIAVFAGSVIKERKWAFGLPLISMLLSDIIMQVMHAFNPALMPGFYSGQFINYCILVSLTVIGFFVSNRKPLEIGAGLLASPIVFFIISNFFVWAGNGGWHHAKTFAGMMHTYTDGLPFLKTDLLGTAVWGVVLFGIYHLVMQSKRQLATAEK
jgi:hypothetical protein